tara:strand:+ start:32724 stop:34037 length:1314 start_codon:yes stop_codon:yes gene_type:complete
MVKSVIKRRVKIKRPLVIFSIEVLIRDLHSRMNIADILTNKGITCLFIPQNLLLNCLRKESFKYVNHLMLKSCQGFMFTKHLNKYNLNNTTISSIDEELFSITKKEYIKSRHDQVGVNSVDKIFCSNPEEYKFLSENYPDKLHKFILTGNSRTNLRINLNKNIYSYKSPKFLFLSTFPSMTRSEEELRITEKAEDPNIRKDKAYKTELFDYFYNLIIKDETPINNISKENIINIRPHPRDNLKKLKNILKKKYFIIDSPLLDVVNHCRLYKTKIIHFGSSSALELKKENIDSNFIYSEKLLNKYKLSIADSIYKNSNSINIDNKSKEEILSLLQSNYRNEYDINEINNNSAERIANEILDLIKLNKGIRIESRFSINDIISKRKLLLSSIKTILGKNRYAHVKCRVLTQKDKDILSQIHNNLGLKFIGEIIVAEGKD